MGDEKEKKFKIFVNQDEHEIDTHKSPMRELLIFI
jgi:hypothetical protein